MVIHSIWYLTSPWSKTALPLNYSGKKPNSNFVESISNLIDWLYTSPTSGKIFKGLVSHLH